ncbi:protein of unknown function DUF1257 [Thalassoporum mexicanum PCC 7367]|uniref:DUF1257 domain-containing protein n=1 Tax=Thalassoporum mexicanum TaxID=3457544 RepID=UPI00029FCEE7|nr:DUF1257 domain-containing protein [Pseudanabaena sp. PCC 7367]AFY69078.1 protein of unknown function DUF1257 [Pseudanabaena sp. PCC 7367]
MSHFSQIKTQIRSLEPLQAALSELGLDWKSGGNYDLRGHNGESTVADLAIAQENGYDIGFRWNGIEYELVADLQFWKQPWTVESFLNKLSHQYAVQTVMSESQKQGFALAEQTKAEDGSVRLVLQRWNG